MLPLTSILSQPESEHLEGKCAKGGFPTLGREPDIEALMELYPDEETSDKQAENIDAVDKPSDKRAINNDTVDKTSDKRQWHVK